MGYAVYAVEVKLNESGDSADNPKARVLGFQPGVGMVPLSDLAEVAKETFEADLTTLIDSLVEEPV